MPSRPLRTIIERYAGVLKKHGHGKLHAEDGHSELLGEPLGRAAAAVSSVELAGSGAAEARRRGTRDGEGEGAEVGASAGEEGAADLARTRKRKAGRTQSTGV